MKTKSFILFAVLTLFIALGFSQPVEAFDFRGYTYDVNKTALANTNITVYKYVMSPQYGPVVDEIHTGNSNGSGYFIISGITGNSSTIFKPVIRYFNNSRLTYIGQSVPPLPYMEFSTLDSINFYLKEAATLNITAFNETGDAVPFMYMVKDTSLGYPIQENFSDFSVQATVYVPADRNYSIMIYPQQAMPVNYDLNNISDYGFAPQINISFNLAQRLKWISGYVNYNGGKDFDELYVVPYLLEPGNMVFPAHPMPYNMSAWRDPMGTFSDTYNPAQGFYNITVIGPAMGVNMLFFATARNGSNYYGAFQNLSVDINTQDMTEFNLTLQPLLGNLKNITMDKASNFSKKFNVTTLMKTFKIQNSTGNTPNNAHVEFTVDYTSYFSDTVSFSWMVDISSSADGNFSLPVIEADVEKINIFSPDFAPKKTSLKASELSGDPVLINMTSFNPGGIDEIITDLVINLYRSNSTCNIPSPPSSCSLLPSDKNLSEFNPLTVILGGGDISFRMKRLRNNITVHFNQVDLLASGPPDALFDGSSSSTTVGNTLAEAWRFGSSGPEIYDSVLIGMPYNSSKYSSSSSFSVRIGVFYDEDWNVIWNISKNTTEEIPSDYSAYLQDKYNAYVNSSKSAMPCTKKDPTSTCYVDTTLNIIWIQIPHFSGVGPQILITTPTETTVVDIGIDVYSLKCENGVCYWYDDFTGKNTKEYGFIPGTLDMAIARLGEEKGREYYYYWWTD